jgi:hypothetical protein
MRLLKPAVGRGYGANETSCRKGDVGLMKPAGGRGYGANETSCRMGDMGLMKLAVGSEIWG